jgi:hypothetical protein
METTLAYLAGVVDSDGYIGVKRSTYAMRHGQCRQPVYYPRVGIRQIEPEAVNLAHSTFGGGLSLEPRGMWCWQVTNRKAAAALTALLPYLRIKPEQARNALTVAAINDEGKGRHPVPAIVKGEPLVDANTAAATLSFPVGSIYQAVKHGSVPFVRKGRRIYLPVSYLETWAQRGSPRRPAERGERLEALFLRAKALNHR